MCYFSCSVGTTNGGPFETALISTYKAKPPPFFFITGLRWRPYGMLSVTELIWELRSVLTAWSHLSSNAADNISLIIKLTGHPAVFRLWYRSLDEFACGVCWIWIVRRHSVPPQFLHSIVQTSVLPICVDLFQYTFSDWLCSTLALFFLIVSSTLYSLVFSLCTTNCNK